MATTTRREPGDAQGVFASAPELPLHKRRRSGPALAAHCRRPALRLSLFASLLTGSLAGHAQTQVQLPDKVPRNALHIEAAVTAEATATNNVSMAPAASALSDVVLSVAPELRLLGRGAGWKIDGKVGLTALVNLAHRGSDRLLPSTDVSLTTQLVDRWLAIDSRVAATAEQTSPFRASSNTVSSSNLQNTYLLMFSPTLDHELDPNTRVFARSANTWLHQAAAGGSGASLSTSVQKNEAWYETRPRPLGWRFEASRLDSRDQAQSDPVLQLDTVRAVASYALVPQVSLNLRGGHDHVIYGANSQSDRIVGAGLLWLPSERSRVETYVEQHFYGTGWNFAASHRNPGLTLALDGGRSLGTYASAIGTLTPGGNVADLLDTMLASRITDAAQRSAAVQDIITRRGLPASVARPVELVSNRAELRSNASATLGLLGARHVVTLRLYAQHIQDLPGDLPLAGLSGDARQNGWSLGLNRKLDALTSADIGLNRSHTRGEGANLGRDSGETSVRLAGAYRLTPDTVVSTGARRVLMKSTEFGDASESAIFAAVLHRF